jgi:hypothetical protein
VTDAPTFPPRQLWAEARNGAPVDVPSIATPLLRKGESVAFVGGKLAAALVKPLQDAGFPMVLSDRRHPVLADIPPEPAEYEAYGHGHGEVHSAREFRQLVERAARTFTPAEDRWREDERVVDPFRPGLRYAAVTDQEFDVLQERHLNAVRTAFRRARTLIVSLSQTEIWEAKADGAVYPGCTTAAERHFDPERHAVRTLTVEETVLDLLAAVKAVRGLNPEATIVLMVSPEPQLATTHPAHVQVAGSVGKAILRVAMEAVAGAEGVEYFPALEIAQLTAPASAYGADGAVPASVTAAIAEALIATSEDGVSASTGEATPIAVFRTMPAEPPPVRKRRPAAAPVADAVASPPAAEAAPAAAKKRGQPRPSAISVVDPYSEIKAAEAKARAERRAAHYAAIGQTPPPHAELEQPSMSYSERQVMKREKALAREARLAAAAAIPPEQAAASAEARRKREEARAAAAAAASEAKPAAEDTEPGRKRAAADATPASEAAPSDADVKARRREKKARVKAAGSEATAQADVSKSKPRREKKRAAKG